MKYYSYDIFQNDKKHPELREMSSYEYDEFFYEHDSVLDAIEYGMKMSEYAEEHLICIALDGKDKIKGVLTVGIGTVRSVSDNLKRTGSFLLLIGADSYIMCHNHTNGDSNASGEDIFCSKKYVELSNIIDIPCRGSFVVTDECYTHIESGNKYYFDWKEVI